MESDTPKGDGPARPPEIKRTAPRPISPLSTFSQNPLHPPTAVTPVKFAITTNAFNLAVSPTSSTSSGREGNITSLVLNNERSPPQAGQAATRRLRRPSMLSLAQPTTATDHAMLTGSNDEDDEDASDQPTRGHTSSRSPGVSPTDTRSHPFGAFAQSRWGESSFFNTSSHAPYENANGTFVQMESLKTYSPPPLLVAPDEEASGSGGSESPMEFDNADELRSPLRFLPSHLQTAASRRKGKGKVDEVDVGPTSRPALPPIPHDVDEPSSTVNDNSNHSRKPIRAALWATLKAENSPLEHEMQSEARLQRFIHSHPSNSPLTPRINKSTRGRFPEMADNDDDDDLPRPSYRGRSSWTGMRMSSDTDSDEDGDPVIGSFAADMEIDRAPSMSSGCSSAVWPSGNVSDSGKMTPGSGSGSGPSSGPPAAAHLANGTGQPTPPLQNGPWGPRPARMSFGNGNGNMSSPGSGLALPGAFGTLGFGGGATPLGSPTLERLELGASPGANSASSPGLMQYRESSGGAASIRTGKRKAQPDDRFDPYKRPRGSSPSLQPMSPSRPMSGMPIPSSPFGASNSSRRPYRPLSSRSRQASPALSIGSTSGVLSTSLGNNKALAGSFVPTGPAATLAAQQGQAPQLGGLGLLSLANVGEDTEGERNDGVEDEKQSESNDMEQD